MKRLFILLFLPLAALAQSPVMPGVGLVFGTNNPGGGGGSGPYSPSSYTANAVLIGNGTGPILATGILSGTGSNALTNLNSVTAAGDLTLAASGNIQLNPTGGFVTINQANNNMVLVFNRTGTNAGASQISGAALGGMTISAAGGTSGASVIIGPTATYTQTSGSQVVFQVLPTYNQASGSAANTDFLINRTQTAVGSGAQLLIDAQVGGVSKFSVSNTGVLTTVGGATFHTTSTALTNGAGAQVGTLTTAPSAGNPTKWIGINDNGTVRYIPAW